jgi:CRISPR-associated protein Csy3
MAKNNNAVSVLAFEKKLVPSDGYFYGTNWDSKETCVPLKLREKSVKGTISNRQKSAVKNDPAKLNAEVEKANLQRVDSCSLDTHCDTVKVSFTLKVLGGITKPSACNNANFQSTYQTAANQYIEVHQFAELARRYALNIANARFLWRNRVGAEDIEVHVSNQSKSNPKSWTFKALDYSVKNFDADDEKVNSLAQEIAGALVSEDSFSLLTINCYAKVGNAQEVYPSEELVLDKGSSSKEKKSKILYAVDEIAAMHSQKIGNAIRSIDTWYPEFSSETSAGPIAIEPYGAVTNLGKAFRYPKDKQDFYTLFDKWARGEGEQTVEELHYIMAVLIRGGVFGESDK